MMLYVALRQVPINDLKLMGLALLLQRTQIDTLSSD